MLEKRGQAFTVILSWTFEELRDQALSNLIIERIG
jgi:hypothetical protein